MSKSTRYTFLIHGIVSLVMGLPMLLIPGRFLPLFGWVEEGIDPLLSRILGAALLALAWTSYRGWRAPDWDKVKILVEGEVVFTILAMIGMLRHLIGFSWPFGVWFIFAIITIFAVAWIIALRQK